ncbi:MAG: hypothetical protein K8S13_19080 [Desulfobacula sp.]|uniref:hypothetical protein n=1 Tax=Desulfobacula sp. TaxID=2593537 RepID=UPI0025B9E8C4|nr:hypothetical protein [Desulfobacula sp.]MCD4721941.1 hypothetical protein [Desulfobacula sp.]
MIRTFFLKPLNVAIVLVLILILCGSCSVKQDRKRGPHVEGGASGIEFMNLFDLNKDGKISHDEWEEVKPSTQYRGKRWPLYDKNSDWAITINEVPLKEGESEPAPPKEKKFKVTSKQIVFIAKYDKDKDLKISKKEYKGLNFSQFDKNGDGFIEPHEAPRD